MNINQFNLKDKESIIINNLVLVKNNLNLLENVTGVILE